MDEKTDIELPPLRAVAYRSGDWWVGQVLEYALVAQTKNLEDLPKELNRLLLVQVQASHEVGVEPFEGFEGAPLRAWERYQSESVRRLESPYSTEIRVLDVDDLASEESAAWASSTLGPFVYADYARVPAGPRCELIYGRLYRTGRVTVRQQTCVQVLARRLDEIERQRGGILFFAPLDSILADHTVVQPDLLYVGPERIEEVVGDYIDGAPDLVIEVLEPSTIQRDRAEKLRAYQEFGVREYWLVDPETRTIDFLVLQGMDFVVKLAVDGIYRSEVLAGLEIDLAELWSDFTRRLPAMQSGGEGGQG